MTVSLQPMDIRGIDRDDFVTFMSSEEFPFHMMRWRTRESMIERVAEGTYDDDDHEPFWVVHSELGRIGVCILEDLTEDSPLFDLRLGEKYRGTGLGLLAVQAITDHVFTTMQHVDRFEGQTREDNIAMRKIFLRLNYLKEAHYRESWPVEGAEPKASVAYAILRKDWRDGTVTPFEWEDFTIAHR